MERIHGLKAGITAVLSALTALWGWFGWTIVLWIFLMIVDYITGSIVAIRNGKWSSKTARDGIGHKGGCIVVVLVAGAADLLISMLLSHLPGLAALPWNYSVLLCPMIVVWYSLTEMGSILENAVGLGAPAPKWLGIVIDTALDVVDDVVDKVGPEPVQEPDSAIDLASPSESTSKSQSEHEKRGKDAYPKDPKNTE